MIKKLTQHKLLIFGVLLIIVGVTGYIMRDTLNYIFTPNEVAAESTQTDSQNPTSNSSVTSATASTNAIIGTGIPVQIEIPDASIDVPVIDGYYNRKTQTWTLSKTKAQYAVMTPKPNTKSGNTFIYGHARSAVFARLPRVKLGSLVKVTTDKNQQFQYRMKYSFTTSPTDSNFLNYTGSPILTLQTCSGFNYQNRTLFVFELVGVTNV